MDQQQHDKKFVLSFLVVLGILAGITLLIMAIAAWITPTYEDASVRTRIEARVRPVGQVVSDPSVLLAMAPKAEARAAYTGAEVVAKVCAACHQSGVLGAPKSGGWGARKAALGIEGLVKSAIKGKNAMPARGGDASLSDAEVKAAVLELLK